MQLHSLPKIELHLHLDCSLSYQSVSALDPDVTPEKYQRDYVAPKLCTLPEFLERSRRGVALLQTRDALRLVTEDVVHQLAADGVVYAELRFAPLLHLERGLTPEQVVEAIDRTAERMIHETGVEVRLILCTLRHFTEQQSMQTVKLVKRFCGSRVVGLDLAGDEAGFSLHNHVAAFRYAREHSLNYTAHAGEGAGPESVWEVVRLLDSRRIGHGTRSSEDPQLVEHLRRERIHLEMCPAANVQIIASIGSWERHPIDRLYRAGVALNVNTDTRMLTPTTLTREYEGLLQTFGWEAQELLNTNLMAVDAAFVEDNLKQQLRRRLQDAYGKTAVDEASAGVETQTSI
ncbi:MAG TPA: adenosine deaminase [Terriglobales bacterium]|nr:adenosine deaminase [Terriglobales bacterium]